MECDLKTALADIEGTSDLLERALKLAGLLTSLFEKRGFPLVVVGGSAVEELEKLRRETENGR